MSLDKLGPFDQYSNAGIVISEPHQMIHDGYAFHVSGKVIGVADEGTVEILVSVPAVTFPHIHKMSVSTGGGDIDIQVYEGTTTSADGTGLVEQNLNRNSSNTPGTVFFITPTITADGDLIHTHWIPPTAAGIGQSAQGVMDVSEGEEWVFKPSTKYLKRITNNSGGAIDIWYEFLFYEIGATP